MAIKKDHGVRCRDAMKGLLLGVGVAVALAALEGDASAGLADEVSLSRLASAGATHGRTLAKAKKRRRPAAHGVKAAPADDEAGGDDDDAPSKSAAAKSDSSDESKEAELFGASKPKKKPAPSPAASDDGDDASGSAHPSKTKARPKMVDESVEAKASEESSEASPQSALEFGLGFKALFRNLAWTQPGGRDAGLGPYSLSPGPQTGLWLEFYPAAFGSSGFAANIGVIASFNYGFGVATTLANDDVVETKFRDFLAGVKLRVPFGGFVPSLSIAYGQQVFAIAQQMTMQDLPQLAYQFVRFAPGARIHFAPTVALDLGAAYLLVLDPGSGANSIRDPNRYFPQATAFGFDVTASLAFRLTGSIGARAGADLRAYTISNHQNTRDVTGAVDRYITIWAGLEVVLDGQGAAAGGDDEEPAKPSKRKRRRSEPKEDSDDSGESSEESKSEDDE
jgi:hypothetical protein